ncbi:hypothetical protein ZHAS_00007290 [Anopheles sinensis]|uniref:Uncharacterized protein n=1 Tax=Anopheles sinensis TaxID=74873 RepID=A0A084VPL7_ANOSI|nr:hypothetical protein ZHAS_00007290 [Anopheles sinensis]
MEGRCTKIIALKQPNNIDYDDDDLPMIVSDPVWSIDFIVDAKHPRELERKRWHELKTPLVSLSPLRGSRGPMNRCKNPLSIWDATGA